MDNFEYALDIDEEFDIHKYIATRPIAKEVFDSCFRQDKKKYYFSKKLLKFEVVENDKQLTNLVIYDFPELKKSVVTKSGKEIVSLVLPDNFFDITFFINTIDMIKTEVDPFQKEEVIFKRFDRILELTTNKILIKDIKLSEEVTKEVFEDIIEDYKIHFNNFDKFLEWTTACRFTNNRRSSFLHFWVEAGFGKSFLSACFKNCGILTECRYEDFKSPSSLSPFELRNSWILLIDEFTVFKKEFKNYTNELILDAKNQLRTVAKVYAKVFLSAEQSPSFEDGVDKQITDRVQQIRVETKPLEKREKYIKYGNALYLECVSKYIYDFLNDEVEKYIKLGKVEADKKATKVLNNFLEEYKLDTDPLDEVLYQLFYNRVFEIQKNNDFDSLSRNDQIIKKEHIFNRSDNSFVVTNVKKVFSLIIEQEDKNFFKKAQYKTNGLDVVLKVKREDLSKGKNTFKGTKRGLLIDPSEWIYDETAGRYKKGGIDSPVIEHVKINEKGNLVDEDGNELF